MKKILIILSTALLISCSHFNNQMVKLNSISFKLTDNCKKTKGSSTNEYVQYFLIKNDNTIFSIYEYKENLLYVCLDILNDLQNRSIKYATYTEDYLTKIYYDDLKPKCLLIIRKNQDSEPEGVYLFISENDSETQLIELINSVKYLN